MTAKAFCLEHIQALYCKYHLVAPRTNPLIPFVCEKTHELPCFTRLLRLSQMDHLGQSCQFLRAKIRHGAINVGSFFNVKIPQKNKVIFGP